MAGLQFGRDERMASDPRSFLMENMGAMISSWKLMFALGLQVGKQPRLETNARQPGQESSSSPESSVSESERCPAQEAENSLQHTISVTQSARPGADKLNNNFSLETHPLRPPDCADSDQN